MLTAPSVSVVIPVLNEQEGIAATLESARAQGVERIVVDAGSDDASLEIARDSGADRVLRAAPGRASQMDAGWRIASGDIVLFLHADTRLGSGWLEAVRGALSCSARAGGAFRLRFDSDRWIYRVLEAGVDLRCRLGGPPYGDQALFVRREVLVRAEGLAHVPIFEDLDLVRTIRGAGGLALLRESVSTSARRYEANGALRMVARNLLAIAGYAVGADRQSIARWYRAMPARPQPRTP